MNQSTTFDRVFLSWMQMEIGGTEGGPDRYLGTAKSKGFNSVAEWRLATALRMGLDRKEWSETGIDNPGQFLPQIIIGPYQGWSKFFDNQLQTTFEEALEIPEFYAWVEQHDRIPKIAESFPLPSSIILLQKPSGQFIHIEGGHRMCAVAYAKKIGKAMSFHDKPPVTAFVAKIDDDEVLTFLEFMKQGTSKK